MQSNSSFPNLLADPHTTTGEPRLSFNDYRPGQNSTNSADGSENAYVVPQGGSSSIMREALVVCVGEQVKLGAGHLGDTQAPRHDSSWAMWAVCVIFTKRHRQTHVSDSDVLKFFSKKKIPASGFNTPA